MPATKFKLVGLALLLAVLNSQALTLGRMRGAALIGQGLDVSVQVQVDQDESLSAQCFEADVFHGDTRLEPNRLQLVVEPTQTAQTFNVRVSSPTLVDEPVVTVYLRSLCSQKTSRRYVLLADFATDQLASATPRVAQVPLITPANSTAPPSDAAVRAASLANVGSAGRTAQAKTSSATPARSRTRQAATVEKSAAMVRMPNTPRLKEAVPAIAKLPAEQKLLAEQKLQASRSSGQSRLKLEPLEAVSASTTTLESAPSVVAADAAAREARDAQRLQALESSVKNLLTVATRNEATLADLTVRLERAQSERYQNPLVYGLISFILICLAVFAFALVRISRRSANGKAYWWSGSPSAVQTPATSTARAEAVAEQPSDLSQVSAATAAVRPDLQTEVREEVPLPVPPPMGNASPIPVQAPVTQVDVSLVEMSESTFDQLMQSDDTHSGVRRSRSTDPGQAATVVNRKSVNSEELFDIRQQAEFFVSLGQTDQAVRILETRISENRESSPLAYLDLLKIFHSLGLRADFRQVREDFNLLFNARVPEFSNFNEEGKELEDYPDMLAEITASWGTPMVFAAIEVGLFRDQRQPQNDFFDLAAFRDLLLLHAIAQGAAATQDSSLEAASKGVSFSASPVPFGRVAQRSNATSHLVDGSANTPLPVIDVTQLLDIDLTDLIEQALSTTGAIGPATTAHPASFNAGNLIDFDLTDSQIAAIPKIRNNATKSFK